MALSLKRRLTQWLALHAGVPLAYLVSRLLGLTLRCRSVGAVEAFRASVAAGQRYIIAFWHDDSLYMAMGAHEILSDGRLLIMVSPGRDGALMASFLEKVGITTVRGSTTHGGGRALLQMVKAMGPRDFAGMAVDGSRRCPRFTAQEGVLLLARRTGLPVFPVAGSASGKWIVGSRDRIEVPFPFSTVTLVYGEPLVVPSDADGEKIKDLLQELEAQLKALKGLDAGISVR